MEGAELSPSLLLQSHEGAGVQLVSGKNAPAFFTSFLGARAPPVRLCGDTFPRKHKAGAYMEAAGSGAFSFVSLCHSGATSLPIHHHPVTMGE